MKKTLYILFFLFSFANIFSQKDSLEIYSVVEEMPQYPGGMGEMYKYIMNNLNYPSDAKDKGIGGKVFVKFIVNPDGSISNASVLKSAGTTSLDNEALRIVNAMGQWIPGKQNGKAVSVYYNLPIKFEVKKNEEVGYYSSPTGTNGINQNGVYYFLDITGNLIKTNNTKYSQLPDYFGGTDSLFSFIKTNFKLDPEKYKNIKSHNCEIKFLIDETGKVSSPKIVISCENEELDQEAKRVVSLFPNWKPAIKEGVATKTYCRMVIKFPFKNS